MASLVHIPGPRRENKGSGAPLLPPKVWVQEGACAGLAEGSGQINFPLLGPRPFPGAAEILAALGRGAEGSTVGDALCV